MQAKQKQHSPHMLPLEGFVRVPQILAVLPVSKTTWWKGVAEGRFPQPVRPSPFGPAVTVWRVEEIRAVIAGTWEGA